MITCTRRVQFCAGHRVMGHENCCARIHGHNFVALFTAHAALDTVGRVIDFSVLKDKLGGWIDRNWDHGFIAFEKDVEVVKAVSLVASSRLFLLPVNPTSENLADYLLTVVCPLELEGTGVTVIKVVLYETENCHSEATIE